MIQSQKCKALTQSEKIYILINSTKKVLNLEYSTKKTFGSEKVVRGNVALIESKQ